MQRILNTECIIAIPIKLALSFINDKCTNPFTTQNTVSHTAVPIMLNVKCTTAVRFAFLFAPNEEMIAVTHVPMFCPIIIGMALP